MTGFIYTVWFRDAHAHPGDQDGEWPACIRIEADTIAAAQQWGDVLARGRTQRTPSAIFLCSAVEEECAADAARNRALLPSLRDGQEATDQQIGW